MNHLVIAILTYIAIVCINLTKFTFEFNAANTLSYIIMILSYLYSSRADYRRRIVNFYSSMKSGAFYALIPHAFNLAILGTSGNAQITGYSYPILQILSCTVSSFSEELYFRFFLYENFQKAVGRITFSIIVVSAMFSIYHLPPKLDVTLTIFISSYFIMGVILQELYIRDGLLTPILFHTAFNLIGGVYAISLNTLASIIYNSTLTLALVVFMIANNISADA